MAKGFQNDSRCKSIFRYSLFTLSLLTEMLKQLGIHLDPGKVAGAAIFSFEEQATRNRLFWATFIWDKRQEMERFWSSVPENMKFNPSRPSAPPWVFMLQ